MKLEFLDQGREVLGCTMVVQHLWVGLLVTKARFTGDQVCVDGALLVFRSR